MTRCKHKIRIGKQVNRIMSLPCIESCHKAADGSLYYLLYDWDDDGNVMEAHTGDILRCDEDGRWHVIKNDG